MRRYSALFVLCLLIAASPARAQDAKPEELIAKGKAFVDLMAKEDFAAASNMLDTSIRGLMPAEKLAQVWKALPGQVGAFQKQTGARHERAGQFEAVLVTCQFERTPIDFRFSFTGAGKMMGVRLVPTTGPPVAAVKPASVTETEVTVGSGEGSLPGTLSSPSGKGPFPAVVLVHGSGPQDQDETIFSNKPFRDLAWGLAGRGVTVLRYVKRTKQYPNRVVPGKTTITLKEETVDDVVAAVALLKKTVGVDAKRIFVLGHSLGGMALPRIAAADPGIRGFIALAGSTRPMEDTILDQMSYLLSIEPNVPEARKKERLDKIRQQVARVKDPKLAVSTPVAELPLGIPADYWLDLRNYKPAEAAKEIKPPMLILQGERDYQVTMADFEGWKSALGQRQSVTFKTYPKLNHLFMEGEGKSTPAEYMKPARMSESVIEDIAAWIKKQ